MGVLTQPAELRTTPVDAIFTYDHAAGHLTTLGVTGAGPGESTIRRAFARVDADSVDRVLGAFMWTRSFEAGGRRVNAIDGTTIRGARSKDQTAPHLVAAFDHAAGAVLGQVAVSAKSNEIPAVQSLLAIFDLHGVVVTVDALHELGTPRPTPRKRSPPPAETTCSPSRALDDRLAVAGYGQRVLT